MSFFARSGPLNSLLRSSFTKASTSLPSKGGLFARQQTRNTTILCVKKEGRVAMVGDGLVTQGNYKVKPNALKVRTIGKGTIKS